MLGEERKGCGTERAGDKIAQQRHNKRERSDGRLVDYEPPAPAAATFSNNRKRQRSRSRERAKTGLWGCEGRSRHAAVQISFPRNRCREAFSSLGPFHNNAMSNWLCSDNAFQKRENVEEQAGGAGLSLAIGKSGEEENGDNEERGSDEEGGETQQDRSHRLAYMARRGMDEELLRVMDEAVYDGVEERCSEGRAEVESYVEFVEAEEARESYDDAVVESNVLLQLSARLPPAVLNGA